MTLVWIMPSYFGNENVTTKKYGGAVTELRAGRSNHNNRNLRKDKSRIQSQSAKTELFELLIHFSPH